MQQSLEIYNSVTGWLNGIYAQDNQRISAEIILLLPSNPDGVDVMEGADTKEYGQLQLNPNFDIRHGKAGFFGVVCGLPTYRFYVPIKSNTTYTTRIINYGNKTVYELLDSRGHHKTWIDTSPKTNKFTRLKTFTKAIRIP